MRTYVQSFFHGRGCFGETDVVGDNEMKAMRIVGKILMVFMVITVGVLMVSMVVSLVNGAG